MVELWLLCCEVLAMISEAGTSEFDHVHVYGMQKYYEISSSSSSSSSFPVYGLLSMLWVSQNKLCPIFIGLSKHLLNLGYYIMDIQLLQFPIMRMEG
jgi:hypothetical protein